MAQAKGFADVERDRRRHFPPLIAGSIMVAVMGVMFVMHRVYGNKHKPHDALEELRLRFARGEISREEYDDRRRVLSA